MARTLFWLALVFAFVMAVLPHPPELPIETTDKVQHMMAFGTMTLLMGLGWPRLALWRVVVMMGAFGAFIEIVQMIPELHRDADIADWAADMIAVGMSTLAIILIRAGLRGRSPEPAE